MTTARLPVARAYGESAVMIDVHSDDPARVLSVAREIRTLSSLPIVDVVPAVCTVLVILDDDARVSDGVVMSISAAASRASRESPRQGENAADPSRLIEIPTVYDGPDLDDVAQWAGLTVAEVVSIHTEATYVAAFVGFAPGFAYLREVDPRIAAPRLASPRARVPRGSVAVAGAMTAVYPGESPGGWCLLGRTSATLFDLERDPAALVTPGDRVRFVAVEHTS